MSPRLSRQESAARTRTKLLDVAEKEFLRHGYASTSLERIAETAGYSKGAVYGNFAGKEELCLAVIDRHYTQLFAAFFDELGAAEETLEARLAVFERWWEKALGENNWRLLIVEFSAQARGNRELRNQLGGRDRWIREAWASLLEQQYRQLGMSPPLPPEQLAIVLIALVGGIAMQRELDPTIPGGLLGDAMRMLLSTATAEEPLPSS